MFELTESIDNSPWGQAVAQILLVLYVQKAGGTGAMSGRRFVDQRSKKKRRTEVRRGTRNFVKWN
jgi:hypothetical protein